MLTTAEMLAVYAQHIMHMQKLLERASNRLTDSIDHGDRRLDYDIDDYIRDVKSTPYYPKDKQT